MEISLIEQAKGGRPAFTAFIRDLGERKRTQELLRAHEKLVTVGRLAATIAHEVNNPLEALENLLYLIETATDDARRQYTQMAREELHRISQIARQTLGFYRDSPAPMEVDLPALLGSVLDLYAAKLQERRILLERRFCQCGAVTGFPGELRQVFSNLLVNAIDAMSPGGGKLKVRMLRSRDRRGRSTPGVSILISDTGTGIPSENQHKLFEPFFTTKGEQGTGLGLWVSRGIVEKHGGSLRFRSLVQGGRRGTCARLFLPERAPDIPFADNSAAQHQS